MKYICRPPGPKSRSLISRDDKVSSPSLTREYSFVYKKAKGSHIWDVDGRKYLDFSSSISVMNAGHTNPAVQKAVSKQLKDGLHCGFSDFYAEVPVKFEEKLISLMPGFDKVFLSNSGTESIEAAYKLARWHSNRKWAIAFEPSFHGRTMGSLSLTESKPVHKDRFGPFMPTMHVPYPYAYRMNMEEEDCSSFCLGELEDAIESTKGDCSSIFIEPVMGEGGYVVPPISFMKGLRKLCDQHGILLCADEVQSGCYRTGKFLAIENFGIRPDIVSLAKSIGGGLPIGATVSTSKIMDWPPGAHANTFGGNLLACAAGTAALDFMQKKKLGDNSVKVGKAIMKRLDEIREKYEIVGDVRGMGLMIGVEIVDDKKSKDINKLGRDKILCKAAEKGLILLGCGQSSIRICPPLTLTKEEALKGIDILEDSLKEVL